MMMSTTQRSVISNIMGQVDSLTCVFGTITVIPDRLNRQNQFYRFWFWFWFSSAEDLSVQFSVLQKWLKNQTEPNFGITNIVSQPLLWWGIQPEPGTTDVLGDTQFQAQLPTPGWAQT
ncbi:hypothetical protein BYT27DRAFT_7301568 [Phlegmacium glaucopus]|nr:hypothetical protein BYT27DRAFT_7315977 [Phlegmacium glaucopus]KAF8804219.1 hypothetical protein BYT27DRAFT_7301568 [Phlegmacium glaucopus]